ncbi:MAG: insulinase family protein [Myxococcales bacterium]|nr:insulinase family protein [Myxococcales bacterium]
MLRATLALSLALALPARALEIPFEKYRLDNGLEVLLSEDHRLPVTAVNLWYHVGAYHEEAGRTGFAHLFEHMMYQGSRNVGDDAHISMLERLGATALNGTTNFDRTNYFQTVPTDHLETALWLESDRMGFLLDTLTQEKLKTQQEVVKNERRQGTETAPYGLAEEVAWQALFPKPHPYYGAVIGSMDDLDAATVEDVRKFFRTWYSPANATLAVVGDFEPARAKSLIEKYFGALPGGNRPKLPEVASVRAEKETVLRFEEKVALLPKLFAMWHSPAIFSEGDATADVLASVLSDGKASRLYQRLVHEKQLAQSVVAAQQSMGAQSVFAIEAVARPGVSTDRLLAEIDLVLGQVRAKGVSKEEIARVRNRFETHTLSGLQSVGGFGGKADRLQSYNHFLGEPGFLAKDLARYDRVTPEAVLELARTVLSDQRRVVMHAVPRKTAPVAAEPPKPAPAEKAVDPEAWRASPPKPGEAPALVTPAFKQVVLENGLTVIVSERHELPLVAAVVAVVAGSAADPKGKAGLAELTYGLLLEGAGGRDALALDAAFADLGTQPWVRVSPDGATVGATVLKRNADAGLSLLADVVLRPRFEPKSFERRKKQHLADLASKVGSPHFLASDAFTATAFGADHPYGHVTSGTPPTISPLSLPDARRFWSERVGPKASALVLAGDLSFEEAGALARKWFGGWKGAAQPAASPPEPKVEKRRRVVYVPKQGLNQTVIVMGRPALAAGHPDELALDLASTVFGGFFGSRLNMNLREAKGYSYGARAYVDARRGVGPLVASSAVRADVTGPAISEFLNELSAIKSRPITAEELEAARTGRIRSIPGSFETAEGLAGAGAGLFLEAQPLDRYERIIAGYRAADLGSVQRAAEAYLDPDKLGVVLVGDPEVISSQVPKLELGPLEARPAAEPKSN